MKTHKNLFPQIVAFNNLLLAAQLAQRGKRKNPVVAQFNINLEKELWRLHEELVGGTYQPGPYHTFHIEDPKPRMISAAPYRDRVVHHALCNVTGPLLERSMIADSYANRRGKGTHRAILRYQEFAQRYRYVFKADIRKFFPSIDHAILKEVLRCKIGCAATLRLMDGIIDNSNPQEAHLHYFPGDDLFTPQLRRRGLPIGNLTSQLWGNYYLNPMDHFLKDRWGCPAYIRYVDDFVVFHDDKSFLHETKAALEEFLHAYRLVLHPAKSRIHQVKEGVLFLGHRVFPDFRLLNPANVRRFKERLQGMAQEVVAGTLSLETVGRRVQAWNGHAKFSNTYRLRSKLFATFKSQLNKV